MVKNLKVQLQAGHIIASNPGTNTSGFTALPGGVRNTSGGSSGNPTNGAFWTSTPSGSYSYYREMYYGYNTVYRIAVPNIFGFSVRCVKD
ncbi:MAG: FISUMP domain-containing protein [Bacteroidales bacterium]